jgi:hypothetical protein
MMKSVILGDFIIAKLRRQSGDVKPMDSIPTWHVIHSGYLMLTAEAADSLSGFVAAIL